MKLNAFLPRTMHEWLYFIATLAILAGVVLSLISWYRICSTECSESHNWRLFGLPFEYAGMAFFIPLATVNGLSKNRRSFAFLTSLFLAGALGAELKFIFVQKYQIGHWCPVCLSIAACIGIAALCYGIKYVTELKSLLQKRPEGELMNSILKGMTGISVFVLGFLIATVGISRFDQIAAAENTIKESLYFGNKSSPVEVYMFTDWSCPACRQLEPDLERMSPAIMEKAKLTFVDHAIHTETLNYSPYNVSFMIKNKPQYFALREALTKLSITNPAPKDEDIEKIAENAGVKYQQLNFADITLSQKYFKQLAKQFSIHQTPTMVIINTQTKKGKKLTGIPEITESNVLKAIDSLK